MSNYTVDTKNLACEDVKLIRIKGNNFFDKSIIIFIINFYDEFVFGRRQVISPHF